MQDKTSITLQGTCIPASCQGMTFTTREEGERGINKNKCDSLETMTLSQIPNVTFKIFQPFPVNTSEIYAWNPA